MLIDLCFVVRPFVRSFVRSFVRWQLSDSLVQMAPHVKNRIGQMFLGCTYSDHSYLNVSIPPSYDLALRCDPNLAQAKSQASWDHYTDRPWLTVGILNPNLRQSQFADMLAYACIRQHIMLACASICWHIPAYAGMC